MDALTPNEATPVFQVGKGRVYISTLYHINTQKTIQIFGPFTNPKHAHDRGQQEADKKNAEKPPYIQGLPDYTHKTWELTP